MPLPLAAIPVALSAINKLLAFRDRADRILSEQEATTNLPFLLPPISDVDLDDLPDMKIFFKKEENAHILAALGLEALFRKFENQGASLNDKRTLLRAFAQANGDERVVDPGFLMAEDVGDDPDRIAWMMVGSARLSNNPAPLRLILTIARSAAEFAGENAHIFVNGPRTQGIVRTLLLEFSKDTKLDDRALSLVARRLVGSAVSAALDNQAHLPKHPALALLFSSLETLRQEINAKPGADGAGTDFVASIATWDGFEQVVTTYLLKAPQDTKFLEVLDKITGIRTLDDNDQTDLANLLRGGLKAVLEETGKAIRESGGIPELLENPEAIAGILEGTIAVIADNADAVIGNKLGNKPLVAALITIVADEVGNRPAGLFRDVANGALFAALFQASLATIAAKPDLVTSQLKIDDGKVRATVGALIGGVADALKVIDPTHVDTTRGREILRSIAANSLIVLSENPRILGVRHAFAQKIVSGTLVAAVELAVHGLDEDRAIALVRSVLDTATVNIGLVNLDDHLRAVLVSFGTVVARDLTLERLGDARQGAALVLEGLSAIAANPDVWKGFGEKDLVKSLISGLFEALAEATGDGTKPLAAVLSGPVMVAAFRESLLAVSRFSRDKIESLEKSENLKAALVDILKQADAEIGKGIDGENLPQFLFRVVQALLKTPDALGDSDTARNKRKEIFESVKAIVTN